MQATDLANQVASSEWVRCVCVLLATVLSSGRSADMTDTEDVLCMSAARDVTLSSGSSPGRGVDGERAWPRSTRVQS